MTQLPLLVMLSLLHSATYHFANNGNDDRTPEQANLAATPWKHLARLKTVTLAPGDSILLQRGDRFLETFALSDAHGSPTAPIVIGSYGVKKDTPYISGLEAVTNWVRDNDSVWSAPWPANQRPTQVFWGGRKSPLTRFPNKGWLTISNIFGDTGMVASVPEALLRDSIILMVRSAPWTLEPRILLGHSEVMLRIGKPSFNSIAVGMQFYLTDVPGALGPGSWATDTKRRRLLWMPSSKENPQGLEVSSRDGIQITQSSWVEIVGLQIEGTSRRGIQVQGEHITVKDCHLKNPGLWGIELVGRENHTIGCSVLGASATSIRSQGKRNSIESSSIARTAMPEDLGREGMGPSCCGGRAIDVAGDSTFVRANRIDSTGYHGIAFAGSYTRIEGNEVYHSCLTKDDCGGIYTWNGKLSHEAPGATGSILAGNLVQDSRSDGPSAHGIYLDDAVHDVQVNGNVVSGNDRGIYLHNTNRIAVTRNHLSGNRTSQLAIIHDMAAGPGLMRDNRSEGNRMEGLPGQSATPEVANQQPQTMTLATFAKDTVCEDLLVERICSSEGVVLERQVRNVKTGPEQIRNGQFALPLHWSGWPNLLRLSAGTPQECGNSPCLKIAHPGDSQKQSALVNDGSHFSVEAGQWWLVSFWARGDSTGQPLRIVLRQAGKSYAPLAPSRELQLDTGWKEYRFVLQSNAQETSARLDFMIGSDQGNRWLKRVSVRQVIAPALQKSL